MIAVDTNVLADFMLAKSGKLAGNQPASKRPQVDPESHAYGGEYKGEQDEEPIVCSPSERKQDDCRPGNGHAHGNHGQGDEAERQDGADERPNPKYDIRFHESHTRFDQSLTALDPGRSSLDPGYELAPGELEIEQFARKPWGRPTPQCLTRDDKNEDTSQNGHPGDGANGRNGENTRKQEQWTVTSSVEHAHDVLDADAALPFRLFDDSFEHSRNDLGVCHGSGQGPLAGDLPGAACVGVGAGFRGHHNIIGDGGPRPGTCVCRRDRGKPSAQDEVESPSEFMLHAAFASVRPERTRIECRATRECLPVAR